MLLSSKLFRPVDIGFQFVDIVGLDVVPAVVGERAGFERQLCLVLVEQHFDEDVVACIAVEHHLNVAAHGKNFVVAPVLVQGVKVVA